MATCLVDKNLTLTCDTQTRASGISRVWSYNVKSDEGKATLTVDGANPFLITALTLPTYGNLYKLEGAKNFASFSAEPSEGDNGGFFNWTGTIRTQLLTDEDGLELLNQYNKGRIGFITEHNDGNFHIWHIENGMSATGGSPSTGFDNEEPRSDELTFTAMSPVPSRRFFDTDYATTLAAIQALEV